jgi:hypothetical protein
MLPVVGLMHQQSARTNNQVNGTSTNFTAGLSTRSQHVIATKLRRDENVMDSSPATPHVNS